VPNINIRRKIFRLLKYYPKKVEMAHPEQRDLKPLGSSQFGVDLRYIEKITTTRKTLCPRLAPFLPKIEEQHGRSQLWRQLQWDGNTATFTGISRFSLAVKSTHVAVSSIVSKFT